jgi:hypothetical protein
MNFAILFTMNFFFKDTILEICFGFSVISIIFMSADFYSREICRLA